MGYADSTGLTRLLTNIKTQVDAKASTSHTHDRVNGVKLVVSSTTPASGTDSTIITFVKGASS